MSKLDQVLFIEPPHELKFKGPFIEPVQTVMTLKNLTDKKVAFKIKTTAPKRYCVRPNCGELGPKEKAEISVILQPFDYDANERNKHKFLVQAVVTEPGDYAEDGKVFQWRDIEDGRIMDAKLKCSFEMPSVEQLLESKNYQDQSTALLESNSETELQKATIEVKELREGEHLLRQENIKLKEELLQLQLELKNQQYQKRSIGGGSQHLDVQNRNANITLMAGLAIVVALLGIIAGKYVF